MSKKIEKQEENIEGNKENTQSSDFSIKEKKELLSVLEDSNILGTEKNKKIKEYFKNILEHQEFRELETLVVDSDNIISWEELIQDRVVNIENRKVEGIYWKGDLDLKGTRIKNLWKLKKVEWIVMCRDIETLEDLGELEEVGGYVDIRGTKIKSLGKLKKVGGYLDCNNVKTLIDLGDLEEVGSLLDVRGTSVKSLGKLKKVGGNLDCESVGTLEDLGNLEEVGAFLDVMWTSIKSLGKLKRVEGNLYCQNSKTLEDLGNLEEVGGDFDLKGTRIRNLGKLEKVGGSLDLRGCNIEIQLEAIKRVRDGKLKVGGLKYDEYIDKLYEGGKLKHEEFEGVFGENLKGIENEFMRRQAIWILEREYKNKKEEIKKKFEKLKEENERKDLTEEEKIEIKDKIKEWDRELKQVREKIESFGVKF